MLSWSDLQVRFAALFASRSMEAELDEEVAFHVDMATQKHISEGVDPVEARRRALHAFGSLVRNRERVREAWGVSWIRDAWADGRFAIRSLRRDLVYTIVTVLTLGLGLGATIGIFSVVNSVVLRPLPYPDAEELVTIGMTDAESQVSAVSYPDFRDWQRDTATLSALGAHAESQAVFRFDDRSEQVLGEAMSAEMFPLLGIVPHLGRPYGGDEDRIGGPDVIILEYGFWQSQFGGDSSLIGRPIQVDGTAHTVLAVMPAGFGYPGADTRYWKPLREDQILRDVGIRSDGRGLGFLTVVGRRVPGRRIEDVQADVAALNARITSEIGLPDRAVLARGLHDVTVGRARFMLLTFLGAVALVLAIAGANVANLALARSVTRHREVAVRAALGAGRSRLVRHFLVEAVLLSVAGTLIGLPLALWIPDALAHLGGTAIPRGSEIGLDITAVIFAAVLALVMGVAFGLVPALRASRPRLPAALKDGTRAGATRETRLVQQGIVVVEVALALVLLTGAGVLMNSFIRLTAVDIGFPVDNMLTARVTLPPERYGTDARVLTFFDDLTERVRAMPGVTGVTTSYSPPFAQASFRQRIEMEGWEDGIWAGTVIIGDRFFETSGVRLQQGRDFTRADRGGDPVAIVNETMAERMWPGQEAIGRRFRLGDGISGSVESLDRRFFTRAEVTVVGVARDVHRAGLDQAVAPEFYVPHAQMAWPGMALLIRTAGPPEAAANPLRRQVGELDPGLAVTSVSSMRQLVSRSAATPRFRMTLLLSFAVVAAFLAIIGVYGVMAFMTSMQRRDIGIRLALGAGPRRVMRDVLAGGLRITMLGVGLGLAGAVIASRALAAMVYEITPRDPLTYGSVTVALVITALAACYVPARRASAFDPQLVLHDE